MYYPVTSGVTSSGIILKSYDSMYVSSGGTADYTTVNSGGTMYVSSGGTADYTTVNSGGRMYVSSGGTTNSTTVNSGSWMHVYSGGTATNIDWTPCVGTVSFENGAYVTFVSEYSGVYYRTSNQLLSHTTVMDSKTVSGTYTSMYVMSGGTANGTTVVSGGTMYVSSGGTANYTPVVSSGHMTIFSGGTANYTTVVSSGHMTIFSGGTAEYTTVNSDCGMSVDSGGTAEYTTVNSGWMYVSSGGTANNITVFGGGIQLDNGKLTGHMIFESGAKVTTYYGGGIVDFDLTRTSAGAAALVNDMSVFSGKYEYTLTVDGMQQNGNYVLAEGVSAFSSTISVINTSGAFLGMLMVGQKLVTQDTTYTLKQTGTTLSVTVESPFFFSGAFDGGERALLAREYEDMAVIWKDGVSWKLNQDLKLGTFAGTGDFNGDGKTDVLRLHYTGLVIGEMSSGDGTFSGTILNKLGSGWSIAGIGDFNGNGTDDVLVMNPVGASETTGLVGYWEGGTTWNIINGYTAEWEMVATGDFNGDGKCDMLWRNSFEGEGGQTCNAYCTWIVDPPAGQTDWRMVSVANPDEWDFLCAGDFDGNGTADIAMINDAGVVGIWGVTDGWLSSWSILSAVNPADWSLVGVDDFNGDGTDDIAWFNAGAGIAGFWQIENRELAAWQNLATLL